MNIEEIKKNNGNTITLQGFVDNIRNLQYVQFVILRVNDIKVQLTIEKSEEKNKELVEIIDTLPLESTIKVIGTVSVNEKVKLNGIEIIPSDIIITSKSCVELPIDLKDKDNTLRETRLDYRYLDLRREENQLLFKCQSFIEHMMREYWYNNGYTEIHTPKISASSAESGAEMFKLDYFGIKACLSQSPQFYKQMAMSSGFGKIFEIGPVFRAENSHTSYHATEIEMVDVEISWINSVDDVMDEEEKWIKYFMNRLKEEYGEKIKNIFNVEVSDVNNKFPRITFDDVKKIMKEKYNFISQKEDDLERKEEELICEYVKEKYNSDFVFVTNFPYSARSFYVMKDDNGITQTYDLLFKGIEITSGAQREHRYNVLKHQIEEKGINPKDLEFYLDFFKYGCPPHGGFGVGMARILMKIFEIDNIREATFIYRGPTRLNP
ncbi:MAG: aspartate--tRNA(Asn) ligase [Clostridium sp.]|nr:aspartate--tRNA(Asn) ligase [Clostridium sp.]MCM1444738.1 aspartate--tRNA(Asn) ligase [Candidatus Amulumruptor caecigallinarius]